MIPTMPNEADATLRVVKAEQVIYIEPVGTKSVTSSAFEVDAESSEGLPVTLEVVEVQPL